MKGYHKSDVRTHAEHGQKEKPAVNVKVYHYPSTADIIRWLGWESLYDSDETGDFERAVERAAQFAFELAQEVFWNWGTAQDLAEHHFGRRVMVYSEGRCGGWLVVDGWEEDYLESWDAITLHRWALFERDVQETVKRLSSLEWVAETIGCNGWVDVDSYPHDLPDDDEGGAGLDTIALEAEA